MSACWQSEIRTRETQTRANRLQVNVAEREGFEPPIPLRVCLISSQVHSTGLCHLSAIIFNNIATYRRLPKSAGPRFGPHWKGNSSRSLAQSAIQRSSGRARKCCALALPPRRISSKFVSCYLPCAPIQPSLLAHHHLQRPVPEQLCYGARIHPGHHKSTCKRRAVATAM